jgi:hypothetical protein
MRPAAVNALGTPSPRAARWLAAASVLVIVWAPRIGWACSVCSAGRDEANRVAFIATTAFLTFLPLLMIGGVVWWLRKRVRRHGDAANAAARPQRAPAAARAARA